ncbi:MAG: MOSC domain-containing protein [Ruminococcaceae bacterium]|nr:MOSC domain-containing protein [Oscillospiraceae bacterium]
MAKVVAINISTKKKTPKQSVPAGKLIENFGFEGDAHAGNWHRQVSLLGKESIEKSKGMRTDGLCHGMFAENITTEGITLYTMPVGTKLQIGEEALIEITQIGKECHDGCAIKELVGKCIMPREGIFAKVLRGGTVKPGDSIVVVE